VFDYDEFFGEEVYADLDGTREFSLDPFDSVRITDDQLRRLFSLLTKSDVDCDIAIRPFGARIIWVWAELDKTRKTRFFEYEIKVPRRRPMDFTVIGRSSNPGYRDISKRAATKAKVVDAVLRSMSVVLGISLAGHVPDPEAAWEIYENRHR
jgi:hypothetical protein